MTRRSMRLSIEVGQPVVITVLSAPKLSATGRVLAFTGRLLKLEAPLPILLRALLQVAWTDAFLLGQVIECDREFATVCVEHVMEEVQRLAQRREIWLGEAPGAKEKSRSSDGSGQATAGS